MLEIFTQSGLNRVREPYERARRSMRDLGPDFPRRVVECGRRNGEGGVPALRVVESLPELFNFKITARLLGVGFGGGFF